MESRSGQSSQRPSIADAAGRRRSSTLHYQTFANIKPPAGRGRLSLWNSSSSNLNGDSESGTPMNGHRTPLPWRQLAILACVALIEQTAFNSIGPYLPQMTEGFPEVKDGQVGLYVGVIASAFALAQFTTNFFWGLLSDRIGRKPVIIFGTLMSSIGFLAFGLSTRFWHAILAQIFLGLVNGNQGLVATVLGEITDKSNQSRAFTYLPVLFAVGGITGPALGGLLVDKKTPLVANTLGQYPYLLPNVVAAGLLLLEAAIVIVFLNESLHEAHELPSLGRRISGFVAWAWGATSSYLPLSVQRFARRRGPEINHDSEESIPGLFSASIDDHVGLDVFNVDTVLLLVTFFIFQLNNVAYNVLYPVFGEGKEPTGRNLSAEEIGISMATAGFLTILFQVSIYGPIRAKLGNRSTYRISHLLYAIAFVILPFVGYTNKTGLGNGKTWIWAEIGLSLVIKTIAVVGGLTCAMLMITNSATDHAILGRLNGLAQTLSAAGRAIGPFMSGGLFSAASRIRHKGEALPFGIFAGIAVVGFSLSWGIRDECLEADDDFQDEDQGESGPLLRD